MVKHRDGLTLTQLRLLRIMREFRPRHGYYATVRDLQEKMGHSSPSTTHQLLLRLEEKGRVERLKLTRDCFVFVPVER